MKFRCTLKFIVVLYTIIVLFGTLNFYSCSIFQSKPIQNSSTNVSKNVKRVSSQANSIFYIHNSTIKFPKSIIYINHQADIVHKLMDTKSVNHRVLKKIRNSVNIETLCERYIDRKYKFECKLDIKICKNRIKNSLEMKNRLNAQTSLINSLDDYLSSIYLNMNTEFPEFFTPESQNEIHINVTDKMLEILLDKERITSKIFDYNFYNNNLHQIFYYSNEIDILRQQIKDLRDNIFLECSEKLQPNGNSFFSSIKNDDLPNLSRFSGNRYNFDQTKFDIITYKLWENDKHGRKSRYKYSMKDFNNTLNNYDCLLYQMTMNYDNELKKNVQKTKKYCINFNNIFITLGIELTGNLTRPHDFYGNIFGQRHIITLYKNAYKNFHNYNYWSSFETDLNKFQSKRKAVTKCIEKCIREFNNTGLNPKKISKIPVESLLHQMAKKMIIMLYSKEKSSILKFYIEFQIKKPDNTVKSIWKHFYTYTQVN